MRLSFYPQVTALLLVLMTAGAAAQDKLAAGKQLFTQGAVPACAVCHTLKHAGTTGEVGPNLDELKPDATRVEKAIRNGIGQMPPNTNLSDQQIKLLANYVSSAAAAK